MSTINIKLKYVTIIAIVVITTFLHYTTIGSNIVFHIVHRELYFIPILLASFWFGLTKGLFTSIVVSAIYSIHILLYTDAHGQIFTVLIQNSTFILIAVLIGYLSDREKLEFNESVKNENILVLGRAAGIIGNILTEHLNALKKFFYDIETSRESELSSRFKAELNKISTIVEVLSSYVDKEQLFDYINDLNKIIENRVKRLTTLAKEKNISLKLDLDKKSCGSIISEERFSRMFDDIVKNAIEVSYESSTIEITTKSGLNYSRVSIKDEGPGISKQDLHKIFTPFYTTKKNGQGLALAACKKNIVDAGGYIEIMSEEGKGAEFILEIPKEDPKIILDKLENEGK